MADAVEIDTDSDVRRPVLDLVTVADLDDKVVEVDDQIELLRTGLSIAKVVKQLRTLRSATININGATQTFPPEIPDTERKILADVGFKPGH